MELDPRCVGFEGRLLADRRTAQYVGRALHSSDAACFRSSASASSCTRCTVPLFYFETQVLATSEPKLSTSASNSSRNSRSSRDPLAATIARDWRRRAELQAMDLEDNAGAPSTDGNMHFAFTLSSRTLQQMQSRHERRRLRRSTERKKYSHKVAIGFLLDEAAHSAGKTGFPSLFDGEMEAKLSRRAVKQLMHRVLPDVEMSDEEEESKEPTIVSRDLGKAANSVAYVGSTGRVVSHGREFLQCERYGAGDVVGCGVLFDTNTFFFTLNGRLMGMLEAKDVYDLDDFGEEIAAEEEGSESGADEPENAGSGNVDGGTDRSENGVSVHLEDVEMEETDGHLEEDKVLYPSVSLHGAGECVNTVFKPDDFQFDLSGFELQVQKERQRALLEERDKRGVDGSPSVERMDCKDEAAMNELVQDFFLHYGYENAYKTFQGAVAPSNLLASARMEVENGHGMASNGAGNVDDIEDEEKSEDAESASGLLKLYSPKMQGMRQSLGLRSAVREHIRCFRTAQAIEMLEQHSPVFLASGTEGRLRQYRKLLQHCRILCIIDALTGEAKSVDKQFPTNGNATVTNSAGANELCRGWNAEPAIKYAQQIFGPCAEVTTNGKRKRQDRNGSSPTKSEDINDVSLAMTLLLYDRREQVPPTSRALKFLSPAFRESVADELNDLLLRNEAVTDAAPQASALEMFIKDLRGLQKQCLRNGCRVYPENVATVSTGKCKIPSSRRRSLSSSSDDSSSSSPSDRDGQLDDDDDDDN